MWTNTEQEKEDETEGEGETVRGSNTCRHRQEKPHQYVIIRVKLTPEQ